MWRKVFITEQGRSTTNADELKLLMGFARLHIVVGPEVSLVLLKIVCKRSVCISFRYLGKT